MILRGALLAALIVVGLVHEGACFLLGSHAMMPPAALPAACSGRPPSSAVQGVAGGLAMTGRGFGKAGGEGGGGASSADREVAWAPADAVLYLPLESVKVGALRMFLGFWVMANKDWKGSQGEDGTLIAASKDGEGGAMIEFKDAKEVGGPAIVVWRVEGKTLPYRLKEAVLMHSFLDELQNILDDPEADKSKAIFALKDKDGIATARRSLAARPN